MTSTITNEGRRATCPAPHTIHIDQALGNPVNLTLTRDASWTFTCGTCNLGILTLHPYLTHEDLQRAEEQGREQGRRSATLRDALHNHTRRARARLRVWFPGRRMVTDQGLQRTADRLGPPPGRTGPAWRTLCECGHLTFHPTRAAAREAARQHRQPPHNTRVTIDRLT